MLVKTTCELGDGDKRNPAGVSGGGAGRPSLRAESSVDVLDSRPRRRGSGTRRCLALAALPGGPVVSWDRHPGGPMANRRLPSPSNRRQLPGRAGSPDQWENSRSVGAGRTPASPARPALAHRPCKGREGQPGPACRAPKARPCTGPSRGPAYGHPPRAPRSQGPRDARLGAGAALRSRPRRAPGRLGPGGGARRGLGGWSPRCGPRPRLQAGPGPSRGGVLGWESRSGWGHKPGSAPPACRPCCGA